MLGTLLAESSMVDRQSLVALLDAAEHARQAAQRIEPALRALAEWVRREWRAYQIAIEQAALRYLQYQQASKHRRCVRRALRRLCRPDLEDAARRDAAVALLRIDPRMIPPRVAGPPRKYRAWVQFAREHRADPRTLLTQLLIKGLVAAGREANDPQFVRLGEDWITTCAGRPAEPDPP